MEIHVFKLPIQREKKKNNFNHEIIDLNLQQRTACTHIIFATFSESLDEQEDALQWSRSHTNDAPPPYQLFSSVASSRLKG